MKEWQNRCWAHQHDLASNFVPATKERVDFFMVDRLDGVFKLDPSFGYLSDLVQREKFMRLGDLQRFLDEMICGEEERKKEEGKEGGRDLMRKERGEGEGEGDETVFFVCGDEKREKESYQRSVLEGFKSAIKEGLSSERHVLKLCGSGSGIPRTVNGEKMEMVVKEMISSEEEEEEGEGE